MSKRSKFIIIAERQTGDEESYFVECFPEQAQAWAVYDISINEHGELFGMFETKEEAEKAIADA